MYDAMMVLLGSDCCQSSADGRTEVLDEEVCDDEWIEYEESPARQAPSERRVMATTGRRVMVRALG